MPVADRHHLPVGALPRMLTQDQAAEYCGMSAATFRGLCPARPKDMGFRGLRWDRVDLDRWLDALPASGEAGTEPIPLDAKAQAIANAKRRLRPAVV